MTEGFAAPPPLSELMRTPVLLESQPRPTVSLSTINSAFTDMRLRVGDQPDFAPPEMTELMPYEFFQWWMTRQDSEEAVIFRGAPFVVAIDTDRCVRVCL
jgi:hypothetical protein